MFYRLFAILLFFSCMAPVSIPVAQARQEENPYQFRPRMDVHLRAGQHRSALLTEIWFPLKQEKNRVLYGDVRYMDDNIGNNEGNIGIGYRELSRRFWLPERVWGVHGWLDRRRTQNGSLFHQGVLGFESLGRQYDVRVNLYLPFESNKRLNLPFSGSTTPYFSGTGIYYDTHGFAIEEAQRGYDIEFGRRIGWFDKYIDSFRIYNGFYHFRGDKTENISGWRSRFDVNVTPSFTLGARFQYDPERGGQGFLEATLRFPFSAKAGYRQQGLRARLDESPERDIDIVSNARVIDDGRKKPFINAATGQEQRVLHVDNSTPYYGDGSSETPYYNLSQLNGRLQAHDVVYIHYGTGDATDMDQGLEIAQPHIAVVGAGVNLVYQNGRFQGIDPAQPVTGTLVVPASHAPVISNRNTHNGQGSAMTISASHVTVSGLHFSAANEHGVVIRADGTTIEDVMFRHNIFSGNQMDGLRLDALNGGRIADIAINENRFENNYGSGLSLRTGDTLAMIGNVTAAQNRFANHGGDGIRIEANHGHMEAVSVQDNILEDNLQSGVRMLTNNQAVTELFLRDNIIRRNGISGLHLASNDNATMKALIEGNHITDNAHRPDPMAFGVVIDHDSNAPELLVDMGGGALQSKGGNRIYGNVTYDLFLDTRPGTSPFTAGQTLAAMYNYWGGMSGLDDGTDRVQTDSIAANNVFSRINSTFYLYY